MSWKLLSFLLKEEHRFVKFIRKLYPIEHAKKVDIPDHAGWSPLLWACNRGDLNVSELSLLQCLCFSHIISACSVLGENGG